MLVVHQACHNHHDEYPAAQPVPLLYGIQIHLVAGASRGGTSSSAEFTMFFYAQAAYEALGDVLVVDKDRADRVRRVHVHVTRPQSVTFKDLAPTCRQSSE